MTTRDYTRISLETEFHRLYKQLVVLNGKIQTIEKKLNNPNTYTKELYEEESVLLKERLGIKDLIELNVKERTEKGFIQVEV